MLSWGTGKAYKSVGWPPPSVFFLRGGSPDGADVRLFPQQPRVIYIFTHVLEIKANSMRGHGRFRPKNVPIQLPSDI